MRLTSGSANSRSTSAVHQLRAEAAPEQLGAGQRLVDAADAGIGLVFPPAAAAAQRDVRLGIADGLVALHRDVGRDPFLGQHARKVAGAGLGERLRSLRLAAPPFDDVRPLQPLMEQGEVLLGHEAQGDRRRQASRALPLAAFVGSLGRRRRGCRRRARPACCRP